MTKDDLVSKDTALKMAIEALEEANNMVASEWSRQGEYDEAIQACKEALEQEERTQRTMHCGTADAFIAMDDDHKRRWFVQSLRESKRRKELEDILEQPAQEPHGWVYEERIDDPEHPDGYYWSWGFSWIEIESGKPVYTHPAPSWQGNKEFVGLSDDEIEYWECLKAPPVHPDFLEDDSWREFARCIEQALKEKNNAVQSKL